MRQAGSGAGTLPSAPLTTGGKIKARKQKTGPPKIDYDALRESPLFEHLLRHIPPIDSLPAPVGISSENAPRAGAAATATAVSSTEGGHESPAPVPAPVPVELWFGAATDTPSATQAQPVPAPERTAAAIRLRALGDGPALCCVPTLQELCVRATGCAAGMYTPMGYRICLVGTMMRTFSAFFAM